MGGDANLGCRIFSILRWRKTTLEGQLCTIYAQKRFLPTCISLVGPSHTQIRTQEDTWDAQ